MIFLDGFDEIYSSMVAGAVPSADGAPAPLMLVLQDVLGTEDLHLVSHFDTEKRRIYYFASPSRAMHSVGKINLPLVAAIPGFSGHRGNGAYLVSRGATAAAAIYNEGDLRLFANSVDAVEEAIRETGLPTFVVNDLPGEVFESIGGKYRRLGENFSRRALSIYAVVALVTGIGYVGMSAATGYFERARTDDLQQRQRSVEKLASSISFVSPLHERLARLQSVSEVVVRSGGWIEGYEYTGGTESFRLMLPEWVTGDHYAKLGGDVTAESEGDGMVSVVKSKKGDPGRPGVIKAPTELKAADANGKTESGALPTSATAPSAGNSAKGSLVPQASSGAGSAAAPIAPSGAIKEPPAPTQAPFGSAASRPPSAGGLPGK